MENATVLGISIGTRQCGLALVRNGTLFDWRVKNYSGEWSENKLNRIIRSIEKTIDKKGVQKIRCKIPLHMKTYAIDCLVAKLEELAIVRQLPFSVTTIEQLKTNEMADISNKTQYAEYLVKVYPELSPIFNKHRKIKTEYYLRVFEAVGAALNCQDLERS